MLRVRSLDGDQQRSTALSVRSRSLFRPRGDFQRHSACRVSRFQCRGLVLVDLGTCGSLDRSGATGRPRTAMRAPCPLSGRPHHARAPGVCSSRSLRLHSAGLCAGRSGGRSALSFLARVCTPGWLVPPGTMTLAVMTRASLGHTGRGLGAGEGTQPICAAMLIAACAVAPPC
jgi:hypothetical protein